MEAKDCLLPYEWTQGRIYIGNDQIWAETLIHSENFLKWENLGHFSPIATDWFQGSALEPTDLQALPAESSRILVSVALQSEAEPPEQCVPRQSPGTRNVTGGIS